jgi:hypothetical protein
MATGRIEAYCWYEFEQMSLRDLLTALCSRLIGLRAVNTSWDSGLLIPNEEQTRQGWSVHGGTGVTPVVTGALIESWPSPDDYCDEWWFFREVPPEFDPPHGYCNYLGTSLACWRELEFEGGAQLAQNLRHYQPGFVVGNGTWTYCISRTELSELAAQKVHLTGGSLPLLTGR